MRQNYAHLPIETRDEGDADPIAAATAAVVEMRSAFEAARTTRETEQRQLADRLAALETRLNRPGAGTETADEDATAERRAFAAYLRHGDRAPVEELRALTASSDPQGGYLTPPEMSTEFLRDLVEVSPIRSVATVRTTGASSVTYPKRTAVTNATWRGETAAASGSEPAFGQVDVPIRELATYVDVSNQLLADSAGTAETEVRLALADDFGRKEGISFLYGEGPLMPEGIMVNADVGYTPTGNGSTLGSDPAALLVSHFYSLPATYRSRGVWAMNGTTLAAIRKLRADTTGDFLWRPGLAEGQPETLLGRPVVECPDMEDVGSAAEPIVFGDLARAYRIVDRIALSILVNPYLLATAGLTRIHATRRTGAAVVMPTAVRKIRCAST